MSLDWKGIAILTGAALVIYFVSRRDAQNVLTNIRNAVTGDSIRQVIADRNYQPVELTDDAMNSASAWVARGYAIWENGQFKITPAGEAYIQAQGGDQ